MTLKDIGNVASAGLCAYHVCCCIPPPPSGHVRAEGCPNTAGFRSLFLRPNIVTFFVTKGGGGGFYPSFIRPCLVPDMWCVCEGKEDRGEGKKCKG